MKRNRWTVLAGAALVAASTLAGASAMAQGMGPGWGGGWGMGRGMMGAPQDDDSGSTGGWGYGYGMGPGMGMGMGPGMMRGWGAQDCPWASGDAGRLLGKDDVTKMIERQLAWHGNDRLKVGKVEEKDDKTIVAEIITKDNSLVDKFSIDRRTGWRTRVK